MSGKLSDAGECGKTAAGREFMRQEGLRSLGKKLQTKKESTMMPFNLERALAGDKVINQRGDEVTQLSEFTVTGGKELFGVIEGSVGYLEECNLSMAPKQLSGFVNYYNNGDISRYETKIIADRFNGCRVACIDLSQHEEGEGLE